MFVPFKVPPVAACVYLYARPLDWSIGLARAGEIYFPATAKRIKSASKSASLAHHIDAAAYT